MLQPHYSIRQEIIRLRRIIDGDGPPQRIRVAELIEDVLRWSIEDTTWVAPSKEIQTLTKNMFDK